MQKEKIPVSALIFDAGDILVHRIPNEQVTVWTTISKIIGEKGTDVKSFFSQVYDHLRNLGPDSTSEEIILISKDHSIKAPVGLIEEFEIEKYWKNPDIDLFHVIPKLKQIGYQIGILTDSALPHKKIRQVLSQVSPFIDEIVSSRDVGVMKPDKLMYSTILAQLGVSAERSVFIGHDRDELQGAAANRLLCEDFNVIGDLRKLLTNIQDKYSVSW